MKQIVFLYDPAKVLAVKTFRIFSRRVFFVFIFMCSISLPTYVVAQVEVCEGNIFLDSQAAVDSFACNVITGNLIIQGADITDLSALNALTNVEGNLFINENPSLSSLEGLENLSFARTLVIFGNAILSDISSIVGINLSFDIDVLEDGLIVSANPMLTECCVIEQIDTRGQKSIGQNARGCNSLEEISFACDTNNRITGFMLVNAETGEDIGLLNNRDVLDFDSLGNTLLSIRVVPGSDAIGTVSVGLSRPLDIFGFERELPYTVLGDGENGVYTGVIFPPGFYFLTATPYADDPFSGPIGETLLITFSMSTSQAEIAGFSLVNATSNADIQELNDGDVIDLSTLGDTLLNIRANTTPEVIGSVVFELSGPIEHIQMESIFPYAVFGNIPNDLLLYQGRELLPGNYTLSAIPYNRAFAEGDTGTTQVIQFEVINGSAEGAVSLQVYPNPSEGKFSVYNQGKVSKIEIYDTTGEKVFEQNINQSSVIDIELSQGLYIIQQTSQGQVQRKKIIIR